MEMTKRNKSEIVQVFKKLCEYEFSDPYLENEFILCIGSHKESTDFIFSLETEEERILLNVHRREDQYQKSIPFYPKNIEQMRFIINSIHY